MALFLLAVGALALAAGVMNGTRARTRALGAGLALSAAESWLESWRAGHHEGGAAGSSPVSWGTWSGTVEWSITTPEPCVEEVAVTGRTDDRPDRPVTLASRRFRSESCGG